MSASRWWVTTLSTVEDPISLEPLRTLRYEPFELKADPSLAHGTTSDWFDGEVLAAYLVSTATFVHPLSRRELTRAECVALDQYLTKHSLQGTHVTSVFEGAKAGDATIAQHRAQAEAVLQSLFGRATERRSRSRREDEHIRADGNLVVIDDDVRQDHAPVPPGAHACTELAFPPLPSGNLLVTPQAGTPSGSWMTTGGHQRVIAPPPRPPPLPPPPTREEFERASRERLARQREQWAAAAHAAEAQAAAEAVAAAAAADAKLAAKAQEQLAWDAAVLASERRARREAAAATSAAEARRREEAESALRLHRAAAGGDAELVHSLLEQGYDPTHRAVEYDDRVPHEVAANAEVRNALRCYRQMHPRQWDWDAACVAKLTVEEEEMAREEASRLSRARKRAAEKARRGRRKAETETREELEAELRVAVEVADEARLEAALSLAEGGGCLPALVTAAEQALAKLRTPAARKARESVARKEAAVRCLGGLTLAQKSFLAGSAAREAEASVDDARIASLTACVAPCCEATFGVEADNQRASAVAIDDDRGTSDCNHHAGGDTEAGSDDRVAGAVLCYRGRTEAVDVHTDDIVDDLFAKARQCFELPADRFTIKIIFKGKTLQPEASAVDTIGKSSSSKLMVMASAHEHVADLQDPKSDNCVASFAAEHGSRKAGIPVSKGARQGKMGKRC